MRDKAKKLAYILWNEFGSKQKDIAAVLGVSEPTISLWLKEMKLLAEIHDLRQDLQEVRMIASAMVQNGQIPSNNPINQFFNDSPRLN